MTRLRPIVKMQVHAAAGGALNYSGMCMHTCLLRTKPTMMSAEVCSCECVTETTLSWCLAGCAGQDYAMKGAATRCMSHLHNQASNAHALHSLTDSSSLGRDENTLYCISEQTSQLAPLFVVICMCSSQQDGHAGVHAAKEDGAVCSRAHSARR